MIEESTLFLILLFPLFGSIAAFLVGRKNKDSAGLIATACACASFLVVLMNFGRLSDGQVLTQLLFDWISIGDLNVSFSLRFDQLSAVMCLVVTGVGSLIHFYSTAYMEEDPSVHRFFSYLNLFMFSMLVLVLASNLIVLFVGWEGVGLCSYLLIGFWFKNKDYAAAGRKAFVVNRIGDAGFLLGIFLVYLWFGDFSFHNLETLIRNANIDESVYTLMTLGFFVGAVGKSAQIPLFVWLPDAMAGPTPVSALIHAATMVTAGIYLLARMHFLFDLAPFTLMLVAVIAVLTAFVAASTAVVQNDIKKVLAYSTVSQLGFMFLAASAGAYWVAIFHVVTHAFFKACLFLGAGSVIHACHHEQDMRQMGGLAKVMPITFWTYLISTLAIAGVFPFAGYHSKHAIIGAFEHGHNIYLANSKVFLLTLVNFTAFLTAFYMMRSVMMTFMGSYRGHAHPHESPWPMTIPLVILAALALVGGVVLDTALPHYLSGVLPVHGVHHSPSLLEGLLGSWIGISGVVLAVLLYGYGKDLSLKIYATLGQIGKLLSGKYYFDELYALLIIKPLERLANFLWKTVDQGTIDGSVNGVASFVDVDGEVLRYFQTGQVRHYALQILIGIIFIVGFYLVF